LHSYAPKESSGLWQDCATIVAGLGQESTIGEEKEITSFQPHQADLTTYEQESVELVYLTLGTTVG
jgi:hypothetical protein